MTTAGPGLLADVSATLQPGFAGSEVPTWVERSHGEGLVSLCLYGDNVASDGTGLAALAAALHERLPGVLLATDEEGGDVTRVHYPAGSTVPGNAVLGRIDDVALTRDVAAHLGRELAVLGIGLDLAPSVDVNSSPSNPVIGVRSFGAEPSLVARHAVAFVEGLQSSGVAACAKHFPGHGDTVVDSHHDLPRVDVPLDVLRTRELDPFRAAVAAGVRTVMTSHIVVPALDPVRLATFSPSVIRVLRGDLGFDGVVVSDALDMAGASAETGIPEAAVRALLAGVDLLCLGSATGEDRYTEVRDAVVRAVESGRLPRERVGEAAERVRSLAADCSRPPRALDASDPPLDRARVATAFRRSDTAVRWLGGSGPVAVVQVGSVANPAVGEVSWGPAGLGAALDEDEVPAGARVAVVAREVGPDHPARAVVERLRSAGHDTLLVECGWPRGGADLEVFGGSPPVTRALLALLHGEVAP